jgi:hypothetical protein
MPESIETTINITIPIPSRRQSLVNYVPQAVGETESFAELTIENKNETNEILNVEKIKKPKKCIPLPIEVDQTQEAVEKITGMRITGGADFNMPITIFHVSKLF